MHPRKQGDFGELSAAMWLTAQGATVSKPIGHSPDYDLIADFGDRILRVEVKTCTHFVKNRWGVAVCTRGGNQSWNGITKRFETGRCHYLFVVVKDGRQWFIPAEAIEAGTSIRLGGPKYAEFEIGRGVPIPDQTAARAASTIALP
ncbi:MAG: group I intron-associated PD-(D/E)XK endonuclease [Thermoleophilaceae bacterium]